MAPFEIRRLLIAGAFVAAAAVPLAAAEKSAPQAPAIAPAAPSVQQMPPENATHEEFVTWLRMTDLGKMLRRDESAYTVERTKNATIMRLNGPAFRDVLVMKAPETKGSDALPVCIGTEKEAEAVYKSKTVEAEKP